jgi:PST family polysaccharide transporter
LQPAFLAVGARLQNDQERLRRAYLSILAFIWIVITPLFAILAVSANDLVSVLYGSAWSTAGWVLTVFALAMPAYVIWAMSTPILWNTGKRNYESLLQLPLIPLAAMAYIVFSQRSELAIAIIACVILILRAAVVATFACRRLGIGLDTLYPSIVRGIFITAIAGAVSFGVLTWIHRTGYGSAAAISAAAASSALVLISLVLCFPLLVGNQVIELTGRFSPYVASILTRRRHSFKFS